MMLNRPSKDLWGRTSHRQISAWEHRVNGTGYFNRISKKGKKQRTCKASVWSNEITKRFLIQAWLGWFHGLMKEISQFQLHWPMHNSSMRQGRHKRCKRANTNDSTMQQFVMFTPLLSTAISSSSVYCMTWCRHLIFFWTWGWICAKKILQLLLEPVWKETQAMRKCLVTPLSHCTDFQVAVRC